MKRGNLDIEVDLHRGKTMKGHLEKMAVDKPRRAAWNRSFLHSFQKESCWFRRNQPCQHLDFRFLASRAVRQYISVV